MKRHQSNGRRQSGTGLSIPDYGHDRTIHSIGRGSTSSRRSKRRRQGLLRIVAFLPILVILAVLVWQIWPALAVKNGNQTTTSASAATSSSTPVTTGESGTTTTTATTTIETTTIATLSPDERASRLEQAATNVQALLQGKTGRFAITYYNLANGEAWSFNGDQPFVAASSIKMGINTYLYTKIVAGEISPAEVLAYDSRAYPTGDYESGTGTIQGMPNGSTFTVRDTSGLSIRISDNCATNMIIRRLGGIDIVNEYLKRVSCVVDYRAKISYTDYAGNTWNGRHRISADDLAAFATRLYTLWQENPVGFEPLMDDLSHTEFDFGIQKGVPTNVRVAHKIGTNGAYSTENDVGIIFAAEPFVLCVMTEMASATAAHQVQADIAQIFYAYIEGLQT